MTEECIAPGLSERDKFDRAKKIGWLDIDAINSARVLMVGAGAIGNEVAKNLVLSGFRDITVVDMDRVENSNLARCLFFSDEDVSSGRMKAEIVASGLMKLDGNVSAKASVGKIQEQRDGFFRNFDIVLGCLDNVLARLYVNAQCCHNRIPYIDGAMDGFRGKVQVIIPPDTPCLECGMNRSHGRIAEQRFSCTGNSISLYLPKIGAEITTTSIIGALQVREAVKVISGKQGNCIKNAVYYDGMKNSLEVLEIDRNPDCPNHLE
ncbi:MAG: ThiF family adenylyltransferase [Thermoplasmata archaeon]|nr:ThiF family adenylyltransferase [Thermoplasmata archaeon]